MTTLTRLADRLLDHPWLQECSEDMRKDIVVMVLREVRVPDEGMMEAGTDVPAMKECDAAVTVAAIHGTKLTWAEKCEPPPLSQSFTAMIDHILKDNDDGP